MLVPEPLTEKEEVAKEKRHVGLCVVERQRTESQSRHGKDEEIQRRFAPLPQKKGLVLSVTGVHPDASLLRSASEATASEASDPVRGILGAYRLCYDQAVIQIVEEPEGQLDNNSHVTLNPFGHEVVHRQYRIVLAQRFHFDSEEV
ncbi:unnamed protein product [Boreogadus saida]